MNPRIKQRLKKTAIGLAAIVATLLIANAWYVWTSDTRLESQLAAVRQAGQPICLADLARQPIEPEKNAATYLRRAEPDADAIVKELFELKEANEIPGCLLSDAGQAKVQAAFLAHPNIMPLIEQAVACPEYDAQLDTALPPDEFIDALIEQNRGRNFARVLRLRAVLLASQGNREESLRTSLVNLRLARLYDSGPALISYLQALAMRAYAIDAVTLALRTGPASEKSRHALDGELALHEAMNGFPTAAETERALGIDCIRTMPILGRNFWLVARGWWNAEESAYLDVLNDFVTLTHARTPFLQATQHFEELSANVRSQRSGFAITIIPAIQQVYQSVARLQARIRALRVLNALQGLHAESGEKLPELSALGLPAGTVTDPFNGEPLRIKRVGGDWLIYAVGKNLQDDGGKLDDQGTDVGNGPLASGTKPPAE